MWNEFNPDDYNLSIAPSAYQAEDTAAEAAPYEGADPFAYTQGSLLTPWTETFKYNGPTGGAVAEYVPFEYDNFSYDWKPYAEYTPGAEFRAPGVAEMQADPGYQFRLQEGQKALEASRLFNGTGRTGGTYKALINYGQGMGSQEYGNVFNRALTTHQTNEDNRFRGWSGNAQNHLASGNLGYQIAGGTYDRNRDLKRTQWQDAAEHRQSAASAANSAAHSAYARAFNEYQERKGNFLDNQDRQFGRLMALSGMGQNAAGAMGAYGSDYGHQAANMITGQGNAQAAGRMGSANAYAGALGNIGNAALEAGAYYGMRGNGGGRSGGNVRPGDWNSEDYL